MQSTICSYTIEEVYGKGQRAKVLALEEEVGMVKDKELRYLLSKKKSSIQCSKSLGQLNAERTCGIGFFGHFIFFTAV